VLSTSAVWAWPQNNFPDFAFDSAEDWAENNVWGLRALDSIPIRIDCGTDDLLFPVVQKYFAQLSCSLREDMTKRTCPDKSPPS
jgi:hypothetical protein